MKRIFALGILVVALAAGAAFANPSLLGPTGGVNLPTADVAGLSELDIALDYQDVNDAGMEEAYPLRLVYGVSENTEIGFDFAKQDDNLDSWGLNAKFATPVTLGGFNWSGGIVYKQLNDGDEDGYGLYWVGSRLINEPAEGTPAARMSLGVSYIDADTLGDAFRPFVAVDFEFSNGASVIAEYQFKDSELDDEAMGAIALRYPFSEGFTGQVGFTNGMRGVGGMDDYDFFVGVDFNVAGGL